MSKSLITKIENILDDIISENKDLFKYYNSDYKYNNRRVPRVTSIVSSCIGKDEIVKWANSIGLEGKDYTTYMREVFDVGSETHSYIENFSKNIDVNFNAMQFYREKSKMAYLAYRRWYDTLKRSNYDVEILKTEHTITCKYFGGTIDALYRINGKLYIVDYKTSNNVRLDNAIQLAAYNYLLEKTENIFVDGHIILQLNKDNISYNEYVLNIDNPLQKTYLDQTKEAFMCCVLWFYYLTLIKNNLKSHTGWEGVKV